MCEGQAWGDTKVSPYDTYKMNRNQELINKNKRLFLNPMRKHYENVVAVNIGNTYKHESKKFETAWKLMKDGHTIITEPILKNGYRPDIVVISTPEPIAYEILHSEQDENLTKKSVKYKMTIVGVRT